MENIIQNQIIEHSISNFKLVCNVVVISNQIFFLVNFTEKVVFLMFKTYWKLLRVLSSSSKWALLEIFCQQFGFLMAVQQSFYIFASRICRTGKK